MKVAVVSAVPTCGKTVLIEILGGVFSRSQGRDTVVFSTGNADDNISMITTHNKNSALDNPHIVKAMVDNAGDDASNLLNYGTQAGDEHLYMFDILNAAMSQEEREEFLFAAIDKVPADLTLIEICGDVTSELNEKVLKMCDCSLILTEHSLKGCSELVKLFDVIPSCKAKVNRAIVLSKYDAIVASDKKFAERIGLKSPSIFKFPYNSKAAKYVFNGELDRICYEILIGDHEVVEFRKPVQDLMEFLFNSEKRKVIRGIDRWYR